MRFLSVLFLLAGLVASTALPARDTLTPVTVISAADIFERDGSLLTQIQTSPGASLDEILFDIGRKGVKNSKVNIRPRGWNCEPRKSAWRCFGQPTEVSHFSFDPVGKYQFSDKIKLVARYQGHEVFKQSLPVQAIEVPSITNTLDGILSTPSKYSPGGYFTAQPVNPDYYHGAWNANVDGQSIGASSYEPAQIEKLPEVNRRLADYTYMMPETLNLDSKISYTYDDPWGERLVDAPAGNYSIGDAFLEDCEPSIDVCQAMAPIGGTLCVCGCFPTPESGASLLLDGKPVGITSGSTYVTSMSLADVQPGTHRITWASGGGGSLEFEAVRVAGKLDKERIMKGGSANLEFWMEGTKEPLDMQISTANLNIGIQGGNDQTATTSGGLLNDIQRKLWANEVGDFNIGFTVGLPPCPCGYQEDMAADDDFARHPMNMQGEGDLVWPGTGLSYPVNFNTENFLGLAPRPPISTNPFQMPLRQLGLTAKIGEFAPFTFEARAGLDSYGDFSNIKVSDKGYLRSADVDINFRTEFSVDYSSSLPLQVGTRYEFGLKNWGFEGASPGLGNIRFENSPGTESTIVLDELETDVAGTLLHGWADISLKGRLDID